MRSLLLGAGRFLRGAWMVAGVTLLLAIGLELLYRAQGEVRRWFRSPPPAAHQHPHQDDEWFQYWITTQGEVNGPSRYDPYRAWWALPHATRWVNSDSLGRRVTIPAPRPGPVTRRIAMLGGSVMWGYTAPDSMTIPSMVARHFLDRGENVEVINFAQPSYNLTQSVITLLLALRGGYRPDVVVSLDGNNDVLAALMEGRAGAAFGEGDLAARSAVGQRGAGANLVGLLRYSELIQRIGQVARPPRVGQLGGAAQDCGLIDDYYGQLTRTTEALATSLGFEVMFVWQPNWAITRKPLSAFEQQITVMPGFPELMRACTVSAESLMAARRDTTFVSLTGIFDRDTSTMFLDEFGHLTIPANQRVADTIATLIGQAPVRPN